MTTQVWEASPTATEGCRQCRSPSAVQVAVGGASRRRQCESPPAVQVAVGDASHTYRLESLSTLG